LRDYFIPASQKSKAQIPCRKFTKAPLRCIGLFPDCPYGPARELDTGSHWAGVQHTVTVQQRDHAWVVLYCGLCAL